MEQARIEHAPNGSLLTYITIADAMVNKELIAHWWLSGRVLDLDWGIAVSSLTRGAVVCPSADSRRVVVSYKQEYVHEVLVNSLFELAEKKVWLGELTVPTWP